MEKMSKYAKIVVLSTLAEPKSLIDLGQDWFENKGRLYQPTIIPGIKKAVDSGLLKKKKKFYHTNFTKLFEDVLNDISLGENDKINKDYKKNLDRFYVRLGEYTRNVYLNYEIIKVLTKLDKDKAEQLDIALVMQLPFLLRSIEYRDPGLAQFFIDVMHLREYVDTLNKLEIQHYPTLKEKRMIDDWVECYHNLTKLICKMQKKGTSSFEKTVEAMKTLGEIQ